MTSFQILFEDDDLIALAKPPGLPTQATVDKSRTNFYALALAQFGKSLYLHHRLDKDTSGVIILSKSHRMNPLLSALFQQHHMQKTYWALCRKTNHNRVADQLPQTWMVDNFLELQKKHKPQVMRSVHRGGLRAITEFRVLQKFSNSSLIECKPKTGRTHQIRVHLSEQGKPILGDPLYGGNDSSVPRLMLHAGQLDFKHPLTQDPVCIKCELPQDFKSVLENLTDKETKKMTTK